MNKAIVVPIIILTLFSESFFIVYENNFSGNTLAGLVVTEQGIAEIDVNNGELRIRPGLSFRDRGVVAIDLTAENTQYRSKLADNQGTLVYAFNIRNMDGGFNNKYQVNIWSSTDTSDPASFGYVLLGGGLVGDQFQFGASALALSKFGSVFDGFIVDSDGLATSPEIGAFRIEYTPAAQLWRLYFEASTEVLDPLTITSLVGSATDGRFADEELRYLTLTGQTTGASYFDNISIIVNEE